MAKDREQRAARAEQMRLDREKADKRQRNIITAGIIAAVVVLVGLAAFAVKSVSDDNRDATKLVVPTNVNRAGGFLYTAKEAGGDARTVARAEKKEPITVELTEDFQCPACAQFESQVGPVLQDLVTQGEIVIEYQPVSFLDRASTNEYSSRSLNAAMCVLDKDGVETYKKMHDLLYAAQPPEGGPGPEDAELLTTANDAGYTGSEKCLTTKQFGPWIEDRYKKLTKSGFSGTPWVRVEGKEVKEPTPQNIVKAINRAKKAAK